MGVIMEYKIKKKDFKKEDIEFMNVFFDNGDYLPISGTEVVDISIQLYDRLILGDGYYNAFCPVVESGFMKLKLTKKCKGFYTTASLYNLKEYNKDRIGYIKNRLIHEGGLKYIRLFDCCNWHHTLYGNMKAELDEDFLIIKFEPKNIQESNSSENNTILLPEVGKSIIEKLDLDFENCEGICIYKEEIAEMQLHFKKELCWESGDYIREIDSGYIRLRLDPERNSYRENSLFGELSKGKKGNKEIEQRLCGRKNFELHDICHLYIDYEHAGFGAYKRECIEISDIRCSEELEEIERYEKEEEECDFIPYFLGGYCQKQGDGTILITFGKTAQNNEKCKMRLNEYSIFNTVSESENKSVGFLSVREKAKEWNMSERSVRNYCATGQIPGAELKGKTWIIPENATKPSKMNKTKK